MAVQKTVIPPSQGPLASRTIESQRNGFDKTRDNRLNVKPITPPRNTSTPVARSPRVNPVANGNNTDERLRAAKERREEQQKLIASRKQDRLEREQRARSYYEQQLQQRQKKLVEQRHKEEKRRSAVEEKRKQKLQEELERHEFTVRRTQEKSHKAVTQGPSPRGRNPTKNVPRAPPLTPWEKNLVNRLVTPTCSYLARSKSAGYQSDEEVSFYSTTASPQASPPKPKRPSVSPSPSSNRQRGLNFAQTPPPKKQDVVKTTPKKQDVVKTTPSSRSPAVTKNIKTSRNIQSRTTSPSPNRTPRRSVSRHSPPPQPELPSVPEEEAAICIPVLAPGNSRPVRTPTGSQRRKIEQEASRSNLQKREISSRTAGDGSPQMRSPGPLPEVKPPAQQEEASRLLAEKRRQARLLREKEEQERLEREEMERRNQEELQRRRAEEEARERAEEEAREEAEAQRLIEEKRRREEEEQQRAEEERAQAMREAALLQQQREEEQAKAEQMAQERAIIAQKEEEARQVRRKRLQEIMRRTRRSDSPDTKPAPARALPNDPQPKENTEPVHSGLIEDVVKLRLDDDMVPVVAFKERRSIRTLTGLEEIQSHQRAEVIS